MSPKINRIIRSIPYLSLAAAVVLAAVLAEPVAMDQQQSAAWTFHHENVMGTSMQVTVRAGSRADAEAAEAAVLRSIDKDSLVLSGWNEQSELSRWMATRGEAVKVSPGLFEVLGLFDHWRERTGGALDASVESATRLWQRAAAEGRQPTEVEIAQTVEAMQQPHWQLDAKQGTAMRVSDVPLALASFTKSYVEGRAAEAALTAGARGVMLNVGGDIVVRGDVTQIVHVADPSADGENDAALEQVVVRDRAVATSGSYRRGFTTAAASVVFTGLMFLREEQLQL